MLPITADFRTELGQQIRGTGHCQATLTFYNSTSYAIPEYYIKRVEMHNVGDPLARRLPTEELTITLFDYERNWDAGNPDGMYDLTEGDVYLSIRFGIEKISGGTEWTARAQYWLSKPPTWNNYTATFRFVRRIEKLIQDFRSLRSTVGTLEDAANDIADVCDMTSFLSIHSSLANISVNAHTDTESMRCNDALLTTALAGKTTIKTNYLGVIQMQDYWKVAPSLNPAIVYAQDMFELPAAERLPLVRNVVIGYQVNPRSSPSDEQVINLRSTASPTAGEEYYVEYSVPIAARSLVLTQQTNIQSMTYRERRKGIEIEEVVRTDASQPFQIVATGIPMTPKKQSYTVVINSNGSDDELVDNTLVNGSTYRTTSQYRGEYLTKTRDLYNINYRGDPSIEHLDIIRVELPFYGICECIVLENTFVFENGFSGSLKVRRIDKPFNSQIIPDSLTDYLPDEQTQNAADVL